ncbi:MAG: hypothetical protein ACK5LK_08640 [Chthoniobacterales bacterium]
MTDQSPTPRAAIFSDEELLEIRRAYHSLEAFQLSPEHLKAREALKARLAKKEADEP